MIPGLVARHVTLLVFSAALVFSMSSLLLLFTTDEAIALTATVFSVLFSLWSIWHSEERGFVQSRQMRRAFEPARHFNGAQVLSLVVLIMAQIGLASYFLIT